MSKTISERYRRLVFNEIPDPMYPVEDGRTIKEYRLEYVPITVPAYPLKKKYR